MTLSPVHRSMPSMSRTQGDSTGRTLWLITLTAEPTPIHARLVIV
ncbi:MAG: hypothetical protein QM784_39305 [Polyangiaceae bacterium]